MKTYQKILALVVLLAAVAFLVFDWARFTADFYPPDRSFVGPNLVASVVQWALVLVVVALLYPPTRKAIDRYMRRHVDELKAHVSAEHDAVHQKLDHIIFHHPAIPPFNPKGTTMSFDLSTLEGRFHSVEVGVEDALHSKVAAAIEDAAKIILPLIPDGSLVEGLLADFDALAAKAHKAVEAVAPVAEEVAADVAPVAQAAETVTADAPAQAAAVAADVDPPTAGQQRPQ